MRVVQFHRKDSPHVFGTGIEIGEDRSIVDISHICPSSLELVAGGEEIASVVQAYLDQGPPTIPSDSVELEAPINKMDKVICIGMNYKDHVEEQNAAMPVEPIVFNKFPSCVVSGNAPLPHPLATKKLDWEVELAVVVGKKASNVAIEDAMKYVYGYTVAHDVSARDWQLERNGGQWLMGKAMDSFCPLGPAIVTADEITDPDNLVLSCTVNGQVKQNSNTAQLIFKIPFLISWISKLCTLLPGDIILTGTPPGVGAFMKPPQWLKPGDEVECYIQDIGKITNKVV